MRDNLQVYHTIFRQFCKWFPEERITRMRNLSLLITGLYLSKAVQLPLIVRKWPVVAKLSSLDNRLRRFLTNSLVEVQAYYHPVAQSLLQLFAGQTIRLVIDCTKVGFNHRLLMVGIAYKKRTLPLTWSIHPGAKGHVTAAEQIAVLNNVVNLLPPDTTVWLLADAGFQSVALLRWMGQQHWHFVIRQKGNIKFRQATTGWQSLNDIELQPGDTRFLGWIRLTEKHNYGWLNLVAHWAEEQDEPWYLVCDQAFGKRIIRLYKIRMWIEEMYGDMKGHGFDLESTHLRDEHRISRLVLGVCLAFVWLISLGSWVVKNGRRHMVDRKSRRDKSYFRIGLDWVENCLRLSHDIRFRFIPYL